MHSKVVLGMKNKKYRENKMVITRDKGSSEYNVCIVYNRVCNMTKARDTTSIRLSLFSI